MREERKSICCKQKIRELRKLLFKSKKLHKATKTKRLEPNKIIKVTKNLHSLKSQKYGCPPEQIKQKMVKNENSREIYDFYGLFKVKTPTDR